MRVEIRHGQCGLRDSCTDSHVGIQTTVMGTRPQIFELVLLLCDVVDLLGGGK